MPDPSVERHVRIVPNLVGNSIIVDPALDNFRQFRDACIATYSSLWGEDYEIPKISENEFIGNRQSGKTEFIFRSIVPQATQELAAERVAQVLRENHGLTVVLEAMQ